MIDLNTATQLARELARSFLHAAVWRVAWSLPLKIVLIVAAVIFTLLVMGCEQPGPPMLSECKWDQTYSVTFAIYPNETDLRSAYEALSKAKILDRSYVKGFATLNHRSGLHTLHFLAPRGQNDHDRIETIGHELLHPVCGAWHP